MYNVLPHRPSVQAGTAQITPVIFISIGQTNHLQKKLIAKSLPFFCVICATCGKKIKKP
jgi:choline-glycine betaine transporter